MVEGERSLTYAQLAARVGAVGAALDDLDLGEGARIGFLGVNSIAHLECWLAVPAFGRVLVDLNFRLALEELAFMVDDAGIEVLVAGADHLDIARGLRQRCPGLRQLILDAPAASSDDALAYEDLAAASPAEPPGVAGDALATISYTGGTTGRAQGRDAQPRQPARQRAAQPGRDRPPPRGPVPARAARCSTSPGRPTSSRAHGSGRGRCCCPASTPRRSSPRSSASGSRTWRSCRRCSRCCSTHPSSPTADLSSLRNVQYAASPISPELQRRVLESLPCEVAQFYGMTEAAPTVTHLTPEEHRDGSGRLASMGAPVPGVQVEVRGAGGDAARRRRDRRAVDPRPEHHARLLEPARTRPPRRSSTAGTAPATSSAATATATSSWSTGPRT